MEHVLSKNSVTLLRQDIKELGLDEKMPVNKFSVGFDLTPQDKLFYELLKSRADELKMSTSDQLRILDTAFNTNQTEFVIQPRHRLDMTDKSSTYSLVDPSTVSSNTHDLLFLGRHDQPFVDRKVEFIHKLHNDKQEKILVYMTSDEYGERVADDLNKLGTSCEYIDTSVKGAVKAINDSTADTVVFNINPIKEGIDLQANEVVWYSTPTSAGLDEQACGRITRLSSDQTDKNFYYLYHKTTIQQDITNNIIKTNDINNIALKRDNATTNELNLDANNEMSL